MKKTNLQKIALTTMAVLASLALNAQAGRATVSSTKQTHGSEQRKPSTSANTSFHKILFPDSTYMYDDGTSEQGVGFGNGAQNFQSVWLNQFAVIPGQTSITAVEVVWGSPLFPGFAPNGTPVTVGVWSDPNGDGSPTDAVLLGSVAGTVQNSDTNTFVTYTFATAVSLPAGATSFFVGDLTPMNNGPQEFWQGQDTSDRAPNKSWIVANGSGADVDITHLGNNDTIGTIDSFGLPGNWLIRADTGNGTPTPTPTATPTPTPMGDALWYNGDFDGVNGLANEQDTSLGFGTSAHVYDDFNVTDSEGWDITSAFSNNLADTGITGATWEIRSGVSNGNGGNLIASGMTATPTVMATGRSGFGFTEFMVQVDGLSVHLDPGTYWLNVTPIGDGTGRSFDSTTNGANCIGTPCGTDGMAFFTSDFFGFFFTPTDDPALANGHDFSMGVNGTVGGGGGGDITLTARKVMKNGGVLVQLRYTGTDMSGTVDLVRDGSVIGTAKDDGQVKDHLQSGRQSHTYQICETGTSNCSNVVTVKIGR